MNFKKRALSIKTGIKSISFLLIAIGIFIIIIQPFSTTGAAIDLSTYVSRIWFFIGLGLVVVGVISLVIGKESKLVAIANETTAQLPDMTATKQKLSERYGLPPKKEDTEEWITLYHAFPINQLRYFFGNKKEFINEKKLKRGGFFLAVKPEEAQNQRPDVNTSDIGILKVQIAKAVYNELKLDPIHGDPNFAPFYRIPKSSVDLTNEFYREGYIRLGRGR